MRSFRACLTALMAIGEVLGAEDGVEADQARVRGEQGDDHAGGEGQVGGVGAVAARAAGSCRRPISSMPMAMAASGPRNSPIAAPVRSKMWPRERL